MPNGFLNSLLRKKAPTLVLLGSVVKDNITGLTGVAQSRATFMFGCVRISVVPQHLNDGKLVESAWLDEQRVEVVQSAIFPRTVVQPVDGIQLGNMVRDRLTGFEGMATARVVSLHQIDEIVVTPTTVVENKPSEEVWFPVPRLELIADTKPVVSPDSRATSGGPQNDYRRQSLPVR